MNIIRQLRAGWRAGQATKAQRKRNPQPPKNRTQDFMATVEAKVRDDQAAYRRKVAARRRRS